MINATNKNGTKTFLSIGEKRWEFNKGDALSTKCLQLDVILNESIKMGVFDKFQKIYDSFSSADLSAKEIEYWKKTNPRTNFADRTKTSTTPPRAQDHTDEISKINRLLDNGIIKVKDLEKYATLGLISSKGVKAWRVLDQINNNYFYDDIAPEKGDAFEPTRVSSLSPLKNEINKAAYRVAGKQITNITKNAIINALPTDKMETMKEFLSSELGAGFVSMVGGITLNYASENEKAQKIAQELRVAGLSSFGNEAASFLMDNLIEIVKKSVEDIPLQEDEEFTEDVAFKYKNVNNG